MFEVPSAKRVKRSQLFHSDDENDDGRDIEFSDTQNHTTKTKKKSQPGNHDDHEEQDDALPDYGFEYDFITPDLTTKPSIPGSNPHQETNTKSSESTTSVGNPDPDSQSYSFNLFAPIKPETQKPFTATDSTLQSTSPAQNNTTTSQPLKISISIRSPSPTLDPTTTSIPTNLETASIITPRLQSHYFTSALPSTTIKALRTEYLTSAITSSTLEILSKQSWPGMSQSHRLLNLPAHPKQIVIHKLSSIPPFPTTLSSQPTNSNITTHSNPTPPQTRSHRARPSKKRRDLSRSKARHRQVLIDETKSKEEHEREKKNRKNRERKVKRRAKERREKGEKGEGNGDGSVDGSRSGEE